MKHYRALISIPIQADSDDDAISVASEEAASLRTPGGAVVTGHVELVGEAREDLVEIVRVVHADAAFLRQLPPDWKP